MFFSVERGNGFLEEGGNLSRNSMVKFGGLGYVGFDEAIQMLGRVEGVGLVHLNYQLAEVADVYM